MFRGFFFLNFQGKKINVNIAGKSLFPKLRAFWPIWYRNMESTLSLFVYKVKQGKPIFKSKYFWETILGHVIAGPLEQVVFGVWKS